MDEDGPHAPELTSPLCRDGGSDPRTFQYHRPSLPKIVIDYGFQCLAYRLGAPYVTSAQVLRRTSKDLLVRRVKVMQLRAGYRVGSSLQGEPDRIYGQNVNTVAGGQVSGYRGLPNSRTASYREYLPRRSRQETTSFKHPTLWNEPLEHCHCRRHVLRSR